MSRPGVAPSAPGRHAALVGSAQYRAALLALAVLALSACELQRGGLRDLDGSIRSSNDGGPDARIPPGDAGPHQPDAAPVDEDGGPIELDAGPRDAGEIEIDAGPPDAGPRDAGSPDACTGGDERCDGRDEDCDGRVDESAGDCGCARQFRPDGRSYLFCTDALVRAAARASCTGRGYDLVIIDDGAENDFVRSEIMTRGSDFLIGLDDRAIEREHRWVDGRLAWRDGTSLLYANWRGGQPDDYLDEDCVEMGASGGWNDIDCDTARRYVCESPPP